MVMMRKQGVLASRLSRRHQAHGRGKQPLHAWRGWLLTAAVGWGSGIFLESVHATSAGGQDSVAGGQIILRQTPLGPMPTDPREISLARDAARVALLATAGSRRVVYIDGNEGALYSSVQQASSPGQGNAATRAPTAMLMISPDQARVAYVAGKGPDNWMMVLNQREGPAFGQIPIAAFGPVGHRFAYIGIKGGKSYVVVDGTISSAYDYVLATEMQFSPDGQRIGYVAQSGQGMTAWHAVIDGEEQPGYLQVERLRFSKQGGHFAYVARTANTEEYCAVVDGQAGPKFTLIQTLTFNDDGSHVAYVACKLRDPQARTQAPKWVAVIDGQVGPEFQQIGDVVLSPDGRHSAYAAIETNAGGAATTYAIVDGQKSLDYSACSSFLYSPDSQRLAYVALNNGKSVVVADGREGDAHDVIDQTSMQFNPDGKRQGYVARDGYDWVAVVDGKAGPARRAIQERIFAFSADSQHYQFKTDVGSAWVVIADDGPSPAAGQPAPSEVVTSADGQHNATVMVKDFGSSQQSMRVMLDGKPAGPECVIVEQVLLSADGAHLAYVGLVTGEGAGASAAAHVIVDGRVGAGFVRIDKLVMSHDGQHVAYSATMEDGRKALVVDDFQGLTFDDVVTVTGDCPQAIQFRADGALDFLAVTDKTLSRIVLPAEAFAGLPRPVAANAPRAAGYARVYEFGQAKDDGAKPAVLAAGPDGTLYGATVAGGEFKKGVLFSIKPDGSGYKILRSFEGGRGDGFNPTSLWVGPDGSLVGSLSGEGPSGYGAIFRAASDGSAYTILHPFTGNADGDAPIIYAVDSDGAVYGVSSRSRTPLHLFRVGPGGDFKIVYDAPPSPGYTDTGVGPFVDGGDGFFYGVAGLNIFKVKKDGSGYAVVRKFNGPPRDIDLADRAPILGADGVLYGFASSGGKTTGGVVYKIARDGSGYGILLDPSDGTLEPRAMVEGPDGKLYLLGRQGLVRVNKDGSEVTVLQELAGGFFPWSAIVRDGVFYSMSAQGNTGGFIFRYGIGGAPGSGGSPDAPAPAVAFQSVSPTPIDTNVEIPPASE